MYESAHGGDIYGFRTERKKLVDFSANINPLGMPPGVLEQLKRSLPECVNYPDPYCRKLTAALAAKLAVPPDDILLGNGAADVLFRLMQAVKPSQALVALPTFADYEKALLAAGTKVARYFLKAENQFCLDSNFLKRLTKRIDIVVLCNPNNPTGQLIDEKLLLQIVNRCRELQIKLVVDECFLDFVRDGNQRSLIKLLEENRNLVILRAFTKIYALPGLRLGFCLTADTDLLELMRKTGQDWSVSIPAQAAGLAALKNDFSYLQETFEVLSTEKKYLINQLQLAGFKIYGGAANYVFFFWPGKLNWPAALARYGLLIRDCSNYPGLKAGYYRIAVKKRTDNRKLIKSIKEIVKNALLDGTY